MREWKLVGHGLDRSHTDCVNIRSRRGDLVRGITVREHQCGVPDRVENEGSCEMLSVQDIVHGRSGSRDVSERLHNMVAHSAAYLFVMTRRSQSLTKMLVFQQVLKSTCVDEVRLATHRLPPRITGGSCL